MLVEDWMRRGREAAREDVERALESPALSGEQLARNMAARVQQHARYQRRPAAYWEAYTNYIMFAHLHDHPPLCPLCSHRHSNGRACQHRRPSEAGERPGIYVCRCEA